MEGSDRYHSYGINSGKGGDSQLALKVFNDLFPTASLPPSPPAYGLVFNVGDYLHGNEYRAG